MLILTVVVLGDDVGVEAPPLASARTYCTLSLITVAAVVTPNTVGLQYTDVLLQFLIFLTTGSCLRSDCAHVSCGTGGLTGKAPAGAGGLLDGFNKAGIEVSFFEVPVYAQSYEAMLGGTHTPTLWFRSRACFAFSL